MGRYFCNNDVIIPDDVKIISRGFFNSGCIDTLKIGKNVRHVDYGCFDGEIKKIIIPENVLYIEKQAFILNQEEKECEIVIDKEKTFLEEKAFDFSGWLPFP